MSDKIVTKRSKPQFHSLSYLHCKTCGERYAVATKYLRHMRLNNAVICGFCHAPNPVEMTLQEWTDRNLFEARKPVPVNESVEAKTGGWVKEISEYHWKVGSSTRIGVEYDVELLPGDIWVCGCIGFDKACIKHNSDCKHIKHIKKVKSISKVTRPHEEVCAGRVLKI